jgi:hypothetical protein
MRRKLHADQLELEEADVFRLDLHESLTPKGILNFHLGLCIRDICHRTETNLGD